MSTYRTIMVANDFHVPFHNKKGVAGFIRAVEDVQPDIVVINGDFLDCYQLSSFPKKPGAPNFQEELDEGHEILRQIRDAAPDAERWFLEGNHEQRLERLLLRETGLLGLRALDYRYLLGLDELGYRHMAYKEVLDLGSVCITHGEGRGSSFSGGTAKNLIHKNGFDCIIVGHIHKLGLYAHQGYHRYSTAVENGGLFDYTQVDYTSHPNWQNGFCVVMQEVAENGDTNGRSFVQVVPMAKDGVFALNGKVYA